DLPPPPPASGPTTPTGTPRPRRRQDTATDYAEARQQLADTGQPARPELVEAKTAVNRLGRLEERADRTDGRLDRLETKLDANTRASFTGATFARIGAYAAAAWPVFVFVSKVLGQWGDQHPEAQVGVTGAVLVLAKAIASYKAASAAGAAAAPADGAPPPPPGHT
ncbi:MAG TPA: hypothetical protein VFS43_29465, partial [Polyangiaceae bacterium]|nr:hypothetical protein [Polyangiaceae bacterium]